MHFQTPEIDDSGTMSQIWYSMAFKEDFINTLKTYGRLPYHSYIDQLKAIKELQEKVSKLEKINSVYAQLTTEMKGMFE